MLTFFTKRLTFLSNFLTQTPYFLAVADTSAKFDTRRRLDPGLSWRGLSCHTIGGTLYWVDERLGDALYFWHPITSRISSRMPDSDGEYCGDADNNGE